MRRHARRNFVALAFLLGAVACERPVPSASTGAAATPVSAAPGSEAGGRTAAPPGPLARFAGRHVAVVLGFTACPDVCPTTLWRWRQAIGSLSDEQAGRLSLAFVTVDPERDTDARLARYVAHFDAGFVGVRAEGESLESLLRGLRAHARKVPSRTPGQYSMDHTATTFLLGPDGTVRDEIRHGTAPVEIARRLRAALAGDGTARLPPGVPAAARP